MNLLEHQLYIEDIMQICKQSFPWGNIKNKTIMITGASGAIGSFFVDVIMKRNMLFYDNCTVIAVVRNKKYAVNRFSSYMNSSLFRLESHDITQPLPDEEYNNVDYIIHLASNTHPFSYASDPIGTITTNIIGTYQLLQFSLKHQTECFMFASSVEVYGDNKSDYKEFQEKDFGYLDCNTLRAGYPESKRAGEALCQAFIQQEHSHIVIPRLSRIYGPTLRKSDSKAISQFIKKAVAGEDIILKSLGNQLYSYNYVADAVSGMLAIMFWGKNGCAYNISDENSNITLKDLADFIAQISNVKVKTELPDELEQSGYSKAITAVMDNTKLKKLGWKSSYDIYTGLKRSVEIIKDIQ